MALYPYPKFIKCKNEEQAREWLRRNGRCIETVSYNRYGTTASSGYVRVEYFIAENTIYYNVDTEQVGYIRLKQFNDNVHVGYRGNFIKIKISSICLDNDLIVHHVIAIRRILKLLGDFLDVDIILPDMSIFLALTKYSGKNYMIRGAQKDLNNRLGGVSFTVENCE